MTRILYGVHGTGHGHAVRALTVARHFTEHEFLFVTHGDGARVIGDEFEVREIPNPETPVFGHRVKAWAALTSNIRVRSGSGRYMARLREIVRSFKPDLAVTDYEYFVPLVSRQCDLPCLSLDHQHVVTATRCEFPKPLMPSYLATSLAIRRYFSRSDFYLVTSFFQPPLKENAAAMLLPPLLRESVLRMSPTDGEHVLAYHGYPIFNQYFKFLRQIPGKVIVYGSNTRRAEGNLFFKEYSEAGFLEDLASCRYLVCGAGHTLISEALFLGKPLIVFPIKGAFEQFLNAFYVEKSGFGRFCTNFNPSQGLIDDFEDGIERYRAHIVQHTFNGNPRIFRWLDKYFLGGSIFLNVVP